MADASQQDRLFNPDGRRHYRRRYSRTEVRYSALVLLGLVLIAAWVARRGRFVDPDLYGSPQALPDREQGREQGREQPVPRPPASQGLQPSADRQPAGPAPQTSQTSGSGADRGAVPRLDSPAFHEGALSRFDGENLYQKIDGRADYFKGFGFQKLYFIPLVASDNPTLTIDVECYDMGALSNAIGTYGGERPAEVTPRIGPGSMGHLSDNAMFLAVGPYYIRAIGSDASPAIQQELARLYELLSKQIPSQPLPWGHAVLGGTMGLPANKISYFKENAFSFAFANDAYAAAVGPADTEMFLLLAPSPRQAAALAAKFKAGFLTYGEATAGGPPWIKDRYLNQFSGAVASGSWVLGVRNAPDATAADAALNRLRAGVAAVPKETLTQALEQKAAASKEVHSHE